LRKRRVLVREESLADRIKRLTPAKRRLLLKTLENESFDTSWVEGGEFESPKTGVEKVLARMWQEVLGVEAVGRSDSFFDLGGDSILSIRIVARAQREGLRLTSRQLFDHPTLSDLAKLVERVDPREQRAPVGAAASSADPKQSRGPEWIPRPRDFPEADLSEEDLAFILTRVDGAQDELPATNIAEWTGSSEAVASGLRYPGQLPRVMALRSARF